MARGHRRAGAASPSSRTRRTARCAGWRRASRRSGTPCWPIDRAGRRGPAGRRPGAAAAPPAGCSTRRSAARATGRCAGRTLAPGGWAFEFDNDNYPDIDDTAEVVLALRRVRTRSRRARGRHRPRRRAGWPGMQSTRRRLGRVRRRQHPHARQQAAVLRLRRGHRPAVGRRHRARRRGARRRGPGRRAGPRRRGVVWLLRAQEPDGSWFGRWGANYVYGTGAVVPALIAAGVSRASRPSGGRCAWLERAPERRTAAGARTCAPTTTRRWVGRGESTASQTAWALLALLAAGERRGPPRPSAASAGSRETQRDDGTWDEPLVHRHRLPRRLLHQLPPVPAGLPGQRARPLR